MNRTSRIYRGKIGFVSGIVLLAVLTGCGLPGLPGGPGGPPGLPGLPGLPGPPHGELTHPSDLPVLVVQNEKSFLAIITREEAHE